MCCLVLPSDRCCVRFEICCPTLLNNPGGWTKLWLMNLTVDFSSTNQPTSQPPPTDMHTSSWPYPSSHVLPPSGVLGNSGKWLEMAAERKSERRTADPTNHQQHGASERRKKKVSRTSAPSPLTASELVSAGSRKLRSFEQWFIIIRWNKPPGSKRRRRRSRATNTLSITQGLNFAQTKARNSSETIIIKKNKNKKTAWQTNKDFISCEEQNYEFFLNILVKKN